MMIDNVMANVQITVYILVFLIVLGAGGYFVIQYLLQANAKKSKGKSVLPRHNYSKFDRADSRDYLKFDDIFNVGDPKTGFGILVDENFTRFVCYISLQGYDYAMATAQERYSTAMNMINVIRCIDSDLQIRQDARPADFSQATYKCDKIIEECKEKIELNLAKENTLILRLETISQMNNPTVEDVIAAQQIDEQIDDTEREIKKLEWLIEEQEVIKAQYVAHTDITAETNPERNTLYIMDWYYSSSEHINRALTRDEIYKEAINKLWSKSGAYISALGQCGVYAKRLNANEILETLRFHFHPYSTSQFRTEQMISNYNFKNLFSTSDFPGTMKKEMEREMAENAEISRQIDEFYEEVGFEVPIDAPDVIYADEIKDDAGYTMNDVTEDNK